MNSHDNPHSKPNHLRTRSDSSIRTNDNRQTIDILIFELKKLTESIKVN